jgi:hypothetical protein
MSRTASRGGKQAMLDIFRLVHVSAFVGYWLVIAHEISSYERVLPQPEAEGSEHICVIPVAFGRGSTIIY